MSATISSIRALEILDSRGDPTVRVTVTLDDGSTGEASVPSGASTGIHEAHELRDGDAQRYRGKGVQKALAFVEGEIQKALKRKKADAQEKIDDALKRLDGTENKERLGANAIVGVSLAVARAAAASAQLPLYVYLRRLTGESADGAYTLPVPHMNIVNGKKHADSGLDIQEFMMLPIGAPSFKEALRAGSEVFHALGSSIFSMGHSRSVGDEGGYAPRLERNDEVFGLLERAVATTGRTAGKDIVFGFDAAASEFYDAKERAYVLKAPSVTLPTERLVALYAEWISTWPLKTIEDPLEQDDWDGWRKATEKLRGLGAQVVGDDFFATNVERLKKGIERKCATAILVKVNQIGTLSETLAAIALAQKHGYGVVISHRSGETADTFIADLAVATDAGQIKTGSLSRSERVEKYNRLLAIERELGDRARYAGTSALAV
ncbi:MAG: enolase [Parcubacteria group bacterium Gr01-1014_106]|nr:MAG: enolase [Parcubacteria group bacterium Gr01-1014_106]